MRIEMNESAVKKFCFELYDKTFNEYIEYACSGKTLSEKKFEELEKEAQKEAIKQSIIGGIREFPMVSPADVWKAIHTAHMYRKTKLDDLTLIANVVSADQSWKKSSGHAFEEMIKEIATEYLKEHGIEIILQRDMSTLLKANEIANEPRDISWLKEQTKKNIFDLYAIKWKDDKRYCFGCLQAKTSIRDRVTRDREPSIHAMQSYFWSAVIVLDGQFLKMPKFINMVNGGSIEYPENGWHGLYSFTTEQDNGRIYGIDLEFGRFVNHALKACEQWTTQRQWFDLNWKAE